MSSSPVNVLNSGKYTLQQLLGQGSLYTAYLASCVGYDKPIVILRLSDALQQQPDFKQLQKAFAVEAKRVSTCRHPHLIRLLDLFIDQMLVYLVVEHVPGRSLTEIVQTTGALTEPQALRIIRQVGTAIAVLHQHSILHRNINPQIVIRRQGTELIALTDLGIGREFLARRPLLPGLLTVGYAAPEQHSAQDSAQSPHTPATDVYGLAATLLYLLTGQVPTPAPLRDRDPLAEVRYRLPHLNPGVERGLVQGLALDPQQRPQTVEAWLAQLANQPIADQPVSVSEHLPPLVAPVTPEPIVPEPMSPPDLQPVLQSASVAVPGVVGMGAESMPAVLPLATGGSAIEPSMSPISTTSVLSSHPTTASVEKSRKSSPMVWLILVSALALLAGAGGGVAFRIWLMTRSEVPTLQPEQSFPDRKWPNF